MPVYYTKCPFWEKCDRHTCSNCPHAETINRMRKYH